jgi:hypothetical protein
MAFRTPCRICCILRCKLGFRGHRQGCLRTFFWPTLISKGASVCVSHSSQETAASGSGAYHLLDDVSAVKHVSV